jgi:hypothetical protein
MKHLLKQLTKFGITAVLIAVMALLPITRAFAFDEGFYGANDILYYDDRATGCLAAPTVSSSGTGGSTADQNKNAEAILRNLTGKGLTLAQASGFVGNMKQESGMNPAIIQGGAIAPANYQPRNSVGFGLVQWTYTSRQQPLVDLAAKTNRPIIDINLQMDYVWQEVNGAYKSTIQALTANPSVTPTEAAIIVHGKTPNIGNDPRFVNAPKLGYEASGDKADTVVNVRGGNAEYFYKMFKGKIADGTGVTGGTTTDSRQVSTSGGACGASYTPTGTCPYTAPVYGEGGNSKQLKQADFEKIYGKGGSAVEPNLVAVDFLGKSVKVHKLAADCLQAVVSDIKKANINYKIKTIGGYRAEKGAGNARLEDGYHYYGVAIDINAADNGFYQGGASHPYDIPKQYVDIFHAHGWSWGGNWHSAKDYMHFEFNGLGPKAGN